MIAAYFLYQWWWLTFKLKHLRVHSQLTFIIDTLIQMSLCNLHRDDTIMYMLLTLQNINIVSYLLTYICITYVYIVLNRMPKARLSSKILTFNLWPLFSGHVSIIENWPPYWVDPTPLLSNWILSNEKIQDSTTIPIVRPIICTKTKHSIK